MMGKWIDKELGQLDTAYGWIDKKLREDGTFSARDLNAFMKNSGFTPPSSRQVARMVQHRNRGTWKKVG